MALQTASLGQLPNVSLPGAQVVNKRPSVLEQALAAFAVNFAGGLAEGTTKNMMAKDYAKDGEKAGFWGKLVGGPTVTREEHNQAEQARLQGLRDDKLHGQNLDVQKSQAGYAQAAAATRQQFERELAELDRKARSGEADAGRAHQMLMQTKQLAQEQAGLDERSRQFDATLGRQTSQDAIENYYRDLEYNRNSKFQDKKVEGMDAQNEFQREVNNSFRERRAEEKAKQAKASGSEFTSKEIDAVKRAELAKREAEANRRPMVPEDLRTELTVPNPSAPSTLTEEELAMLLRYNEA